VSNSLALCRRLAYACRLDVGQPQTVLQVGRRSIAFSRPWSVPCRDVARSASYLTHCVLRFRVLVEASCLWRLGRASVTHPHRPRQTRGYAGALLRARRARVPQTASNVVRSLCRRSRGLPRNSKRSGRYDESPITKDLRRRPRQACALRGDGGACWL